MAAVGWTRKQLHIRHTEYLRLAPKVPGITVAVAENSCQFV